MKLLRPRLPATARSVLASTSPLSLPHTPPRLSRAAALAWQGSIGQSSDNAAFEVQPNATRRINDATPLYDCTTYLSFSSAPRAPLHALGTSIVRERSILSLLCTAVREVLVLVFSACVRLGGARKRRAAIEHLGYDAKEWAAHDGLLSVHGHGEPARVLRL